jgi:hypothetical protein
MSTSRSGNLLLTDAGLDEEEGTRIERTIEDACGFLRTVIADPSLLDRVPAGAALARACDDDPAFSESGQRAAAEIDAAADSGCVDRVQG